MPKDFYMLIAGLCGEKEAALWQGCVLEKLEVYHSQNLWRLYVKTCRPVESFDIDKTTSRINELCAFVDRVQIIPQPESTEKYIKHILVLHQDEISSSFFSESLKIKLEVNDSHIDFITADSKSYQYVIDHDICNLLGRWFWEKYYLQVVVRVVWQPEQMASPSAVPAFVENKPVQIISGGIKKEEKAYKRNSPPKRTQHLLETAVPIKVSELEEGLKTVVVEGEIWQKEVNSLRDGRFVVTYWLTDYTDTIIIKSFYDTRDADQINKGDWIKVSGSIRYDNFAREIVLFMNGYQLGKKTVRVDTAVQKRIELHAHTKMSSMDGLTETTELVKRAAQWGHKAIAITDHGCVQSFPEAFKAGGKYNIKIIYGVEGYLIEENKKEKPYHIILLARNRTGIKNLYKLISSSYLNHYYRQPKIPRKELIEYREGLLVGSACEAGEVYQAVLSGTDEKELLNIAAFYDYLEIQPLQNNDFLIKNGRVSNIEELKDINRRIISLGKRLNKPVLATGDAHFLDPEHEILRRIIQAGQGYEDAEAQAPLYFKTTDEMLADFSYLGEEQAMEVVVENPAIINEMIEDVKPVPDGFYPPKIDSAEEDITRLAWERAHILYGEKLPRLVEERLKKELDSITTNGFSVLYLIAHKLVKKSNQDGYLVGSRGSVGSSLVAFFTGITEVNPLPAHYLCSACSFSEFICDASVGCGADLPDKTCPQCGKVMEKAGFDIPFETFLGFEGDKVPDIDLNFSGDYQPRAHQYVEELFGSNNVFRAGTISTIAEKTAYGFVKNYADNSGMILKNSEINRLVKGITGVKRTTGQHPGGMIVIPHDTNIYEFTPVQHPADNKESGVVTTHFDYHAIDSQLVKLDILGHDDPTVIKQLEDLTGINASTISLSEKETMKLFSSVDPLGIKPEDIMSSVGTFGIPEFGTRFVRQMLEATRPQTFSELVRISGLSHGTDVWLNNAQDLIANNIASLNEVICTRDDIMTFLIYKGIEKRTAFRIMEKVRKGKGLSKEDEKLMREYQVPDWYINSCNKIKYMFPKAHAVAYVTMAFRIAYFKVYYPCEFYASFFSIRAEDFEAETILKGYDAVRRRLEEIDKIGYSASQKEKKLQPVLELVMEMYARGLKLYPVDIYRSAADKFIVTEKGLILPFSSLPNVGITAARGIVEARQDGYFVSVEDFQQRTRLNKTGMDMLRQFGCFENMPESSQIDLFG